MPASLPSIVPKSGGLLAFALSLAFAAGAAAQTQPAQTHPAQADPAGVADQVRRRGDYSDRLPVAASEDLGGMSRTFPGGASGSGGGSGAGERALGGEDDEDDGESESSRDRSRSAHHRSSERSSSALPGSAGGGSILLWLGVALLVGVLGFVLWSMRPQGGALAERPSERADREAPAAPPGLTVVAGDPDELARAGRYEEAIAALLLAALREVGWRPEGLMRSRTAREILASVGPRDARYSPLSELVSIQERVAFGGDEATEERWLAARRQIEALRGVEVAS